MNFKIGDKVGFLNEKGTGTVSKIINKTTVGVTIEDGFEIPYVVSELILMVDEQEQREQPVKPVIQQTFQPEIKQKTNSKKKEREGIYIAFSPEKMNDIAHSDINVWLINHSNYQLLFTYSVFQNGSFLTVETGTVNAYEPLLIETIDRKLLDDFSNFKIDVLFFDMKEHEHQLPVSEVIKLKPIKLYKENAFAENNFITQEALVIKVAFLDSYLEDEADYISKVDLSKVLFQKQTHSNAPKKSKPHANNNPNNEMEIDLHIEELLDNYSGMSNAQIINVQLNHFQKALDKAITDHYRKLFVIHGIGNGRLKQEVRNILTSYKLQHFDASYSKYGFGATEVLIG
jgi:hypothetical protein